MDDEKLKKLKAVVARSTCPVGCRCHLLKPDELCKARSTGLESLLECLEENSEDCAFSIAFGGGHYCKCKTRMEIAKLLGE